MEQETLVYPLADNTVLQDKYTILSAVSYTHLTLPTILLV